MNLGPQMADISVGTFLHARDDQNVGTEPKFHVTMSSNGKY